MGLFFIKNLIWKNKIITEKMQEEQLNILDSLMAVDRTIKSLRRMNEDEMIQNDLIEAAVIMSKSFSVNPIEELNRFHRARRPPARIDDHPETAERQPFFQFYRCTMKQVLDILIIEFSDNLEACLKKIQPLTVLMPPLAIPSIEDVYSISSH